MENSKLLESLSILFLEEYDLDKAYFKVVGIVKRLNNRGIEISMEEIQRRAYKCGEEG